MKNIKLLFLVVLLVSFACKSSKNENKSDDKNKISDSIEVSNTSSGLDFDKFISSFEKKEIPYEVTITEDNITENYLSSNYLKFTNVEDAEDIFPVARFDIYDKYIGALFAVTDLRTYFYIYDKSGNIIDSKELDSYYVGMEEYSVIKLDENYNLYVNDVVFPRGEGWQIQDDNNALYLHWHEDFQITPMQEMKILSSGKILDSIPVLKVVQNYLTFLDKKKFKEAFKLQKNPNWNNYENFSSTKAFGGIVDVLLDSISIIKESENSGKIYCHAQYIDLTNGSSDIEQFFTVSKKNNNWYITGMKVSKFERIENYSNEIDFIYSQLNLSKITKKGFEFYLEVISDSPEDNYDKKYCGSISGQAQFVSDGHAVFKKGNASLDFYFKGNSEVNIIENNCEEYRHHEISFNGTYSNIYE